MSLALGNGALLEQESCTSLQSRVSMGKFNKIIEYGLLTKREVKMAGYWPSSLFSCLFKVHKHAKKEQGQYPANLTEQAWSIIDLLYGIKHQTMIFDLVGPSEKSQVGEIAPSCPAPVANHSLGFGHGASR